MITIKNLIARRVLAKQDLERSNPVRVKKMYHVKVKRFLDSLQIQYYEAGKEGNDGYEKTTLFEDIKNEKFKKFEETYDDMKFPDSPFDSENEVVEEQGNFKNNDSLRISMSRTIRSIYDYGKSNRWEWWLTFTFDKSKVDRYEFSACVKKMSVWLMNIRKKCPDMKYLIVPEQHKDGAWHFHGLFSNIENLTMNESGKKYKGSEVYNISDYRFGFTYAIRTDGSMKVVSYITKYITKELCSITKGRKRYWVSRNLDKPDIMEYFTYESFLDVISTYDVSEAYLKTLEGFINVNICEIPIYSKNM